MRRLIHGNRTDDVTAYLIKTGITDSVIISALYSFYADLKNNNLWNKIKVLYPMLGGSAFTTKFDLVKKNNSEFNITWQGTPLFTNEGVNGGAGRNAQGISHFVPSSKMTLGNEGYTTICATNDAKVSSDPIYLGSYSSSNYSLIAIEPTYWTALLNNTTGTIPNNTKIGIYSASRSGTSMTLIKNGILASTKTVSGNLPHNAIYLLNMATYGVKGYATGRMQTTIFHEAFTVAETQILHTLLNNFESALGRKTW